LGCSGPKKLGSEPFARRHRGFRATAFDPFQREPTGDLGPRNINLPMGIRKGTVFYRIRREFMDDQRQENGESRGTIDIAAM
jgi:hypothetical protein